MLEECSDCGDDVPWHDVDGFPVRCIACAADELAEREKRRAEQLDASNCRAELEHDTSG